MYIDMLPLYLRVPWFQKPPPLALVFVHLVRSTMIKGRFLVHSPLVICGSASQARRPQQFRATDPRTQFQATDPRCTHGPPQDSPEDGVSPSQVLCKDGIQVCDLS